MHPSRPLCSAAPCAPPFKVIMRWLGWEAQPHGNQGALAASPKAAQQNAVACKEKTPRAPFGV